jgi:transcriptional regulator with XRE-family HTH domain
MNRSKKPNTALKKIRESIPMNQTDFAKAVGTTSLIAAIESGSRSFSTEGSDLASRIMAFTGCDPVALMEGRAIDILGRPYTSKTYAQWCAAGGDPKIVDMAADRAAALLRGLIVAAASDAEGKRTPQTFRRVLFSLSDSLDKLIREVGLIERTNAVLTEQAPTGDWQKMSLGKAREMFGREKGWPEADFRGHNDMLMIEVKVSTSPVWSPLGGSMRVGDSRRTVFAEHFDPQRTKVEVRLPRSLKGNRVRVFSFVRGAVHGVGSASLLQRAVAHAEKKAKKTGR